MKSFLHATRPLLTTMVQATTPARVKEHIRIAVEKNTDAIGFQL